MLADDAACNARNTYPGAVYANAGRGLDLYGDNIEVDYRGYEVTVEAFIRLLTGRVPPGTPRSKRLLTNDRSNVFVYLTGHGGNDFLKFQDNEEISAFDLADAVETMWQKKRCALRDDLAAADARRYNELFFMVDSCQANSLYSRFYSPNVLATASSRVGENSLAVGALLLSSVPPVLCAALVRVRLRHRRMGHRLVHAFRPRLARADQQDVAGDDARSGAPRFVDRRGS